MIARLSGILLEKEPPTLLIDVNGVGYEVEAPASVFYDLPEIGQPIIMLIHMQVSQDHQTLYGFRSSSERILFRQLMKISGIGAKLALTILSGASGDELARFVADGDTASLTRLPGIGKKTAERIIIELRDKLDGLPVSLPSTGAGAAQPAGNAISEASNALRALGYKTAEVNHMVRNVAEADMSAEEIIRKALQSMVKV